MAARRLRGGKGVARTIAQMKLWLFLCLARFSDTAYSSSSWCPVGPRLHFASPPPRLVYTHTDIRRIVVVPGLSPLALSHLGPPFVHGRQCVLRPLQCDVFRAAGSFGPRQLTPARFARTRRMTRDVKRSDNAASSRRRRSPLRRDDAIACGRARPSSLGKRLFITLCSAHILVSETKTLRGLRSKRDFHTCVCVCVFLLFFFFVSFFFYKRTARSM